MKSVTVYKPESFKMASGLIDNVAGGYCINHKEIDGDWYLAKPQMYVTVRKKLRWCKEILQGKAIAVHYKEDEV